MLRFEASQGADQAYLGKSHRYTQFLKLDFVCFDSYCNKKCSIGGFSWGHRPAPFCSFLVVSF